MSELRTQNTPGIVKQELFRKKINDLAKDFRGNSFVTENCQTDFVPNRENSGNKCGQNAELCV